MQPGVPARPALEQKPTYYGTLAVLVIFVTTMCSLVLSHVRMMWADELLSYWGDRLPSAADVLRVQLHYPISLDPPTYHLLAHWSMKLFGENALGMRIPALFGVILAQVALFFFVKRISGPRAAVIAAALPAALGPFWYSAEGRPYGWLLGMYGVAIGCWHFAAYRDVDEQRAWQLGGLALAIAGAITSHYFGVLVLLPIGAGELARIAERRRVDWPMIAAIAAGTASLALILPFQKALKVYQLHYYNRNVTLQAIKLGYTNAISQSLAVTCVGLLVVAFAAYIRFRRHERRTTGATWTMLFTLLLMPVWCWMFERFVTHSMEGRYAIPAMIAVVAIVAMALDKALDNFRVFCGVLTAVILLGVASIAVKVRRELRFRHDFMGQLAVPLGAGSTKPIYINSFGDFLPDQYYAPPELKARLHYVYDADEEIRWKGRDTHSISAVNVRNYAPLQVTPYSEFLRQNDPLILVYGVENWEWLPSDLQARQVPVQPLGELMLGKLEQADTHPSGMAASPTQQ